MEELEALRGRVERDFLLDEDNIRGKSLEVPKIYHRYLREFTTRSLELKVKRAELERVFGERVKYYKEEYDRELKMSEIEKYVFVEERYYNLHLDIIRLESLCRYLEDVVKRANGLPYDIKNYIDLRKFIDGG